MTREEAKKLLPIFKEFSEGETIQHLDIINDKWEDVDEFVYHGSVKSYRIKSDSQPKAKYRPFVNTEECWQEMLKHQPFGWVKNNNLYRNILETIDGAILLPSFPGEMFVFSFNKAKEKFTFADGTPFGIKVEG